jgi:hypothetical protein
MNPINNWRMKGKPPIQTECFDLNSIMNFNQDVGKVLTLPDGQKLMQNLSNYFVTWGIFLALNGCVETNYETKKEEEHSVSYLG